MQWAFAAYYVCDFRGVRIVETAKWGPQSHSVNTSILCPACLFLYLGRNAFGGDFLRQLAGFLQFLSAKLLQVFSKCQ